MSEFKQMVRTLHEAGIEVILDVVYNHTAEGNDGGPTLSFRGLDNAAYYRLSPEDQRRYVDYTGTGNSLNMRHPHVLAADHGQPALLGHRDARRRLPLRPGVDARPASCTTSTGCRRSSTSSSRTRWCSGVKLIAEPWDVGEGGYQVGNFPPLWTEWNGKYRDTVRDYWRGADGTVGELAARLSGSSDLYENNGRRPFASINFVTCHDGFTLTDLVSYEQKHNEANGEDNRDGNDDNRSWNCGVEGPTDDPASSTPGAPASSATSWPRCCCRKACP